MKNTFTACMCFVILGCGKVAPETESGEEGPVVAVPAPASETSSTSTGEDVESAETSSAPDTNFTPSEVEKHCKFSCEFPLPEDGSSCDVALDQYCEYESICKSSNCNTASGKWEVGDLDPCSCYVGP